MIPDEYSNLLAMGQSFSDMGVADTGLLKKDALAAVEILRKACVPILGGDVWTMVGQKWRVTGDWYTQRRPGETESAYAARTFEESSRYITRYPDPEDGTIYFVLVIAD